MVRHLLVAVMVASGCTGTIDSSTTGADNTLPDASGGGGGGGGGGAGGGVTGGDGGTTNAMFPCKNLAAANGNGHHNPGQDCLNGCHNHGFTLAGTLYDAAGMTALAGGTITVKDANGAMFDMVAAQNGNFYTSQAIAFPIAVYASSCPTSTPMTAAVASGSGGCNKSGCHATGGQGHVHL